MTCPARQIATFWVEVGVEFASRLERSITSNIDLVRQDKTRGVLAFARLPETLKGKLSASAGVVKAYLACLDMTERAHDKMSACDELG